MIVDIEPGRYTGKVEDCTEDGVFTILIVGAGQRHERIRLALCDVPGVVVRQLDADDLDLAHLNGTCHDLCVVDEVFGCDEIPAAKPYIHSATRRGKGERKRNKAERWR